MYVAASHRGLGVADLLIRHAEAIIGERLLFPRLTAIAESAWSHG